MVRVVCLYVLGTGISRASGSGYPPDGYGCSTMLTHVHGNLLNISDLVRSLTVSPHTIAGDLDVLEGAYMIRRLQPYHANVQKRLTKSAKIYLRDSGLLHSRRDEQARTSSPASRG